MKCNLAAVILTDSPDTEICELGCSKAALYGGGGSSEGGTKEGGLMVSIQFEYWTD